MNQASLASEPATDAPAGDGWAAVAAEHRAGGATAPVSGQARQRVLVIVPAYNEEATIRRVVNGLRSAVPDAARLVVTDGSRDRTADIVDELGERHLRLPGNVGYGCALQAGIRYGLARGYETMVFVDADGQHDPRYVPALVDALDRTGSDVVIGSRFVQGRGYAGPRGRVLGQYVFSLVTRLLMGRRIYDTTSGLKAMRAAACEAVLAGRFLDFHTEALVRLSMLGYRIAEYPIEVHERTEGRSMHSIASAVEYPVKTLLLTFVGILDALSRRKPR
jgi:glycosyltransferase involved in cell wall biosynthesis